MKSDSPLVSIICVSMNHSAYIKEGMQSFIDQTYPNVEILYLDNASADNTYEIAETLLTAGNKRYQSFKREKNYNLPENFNYLIKKASGKYMCFISCDDWMLPQFIETMVKEYEAKQQIGLLYSNGWYYYEDKKEFALAENKKFISGKIFDHVFLYGVLFPIGIMVKREVLDKVGLYDENIPVEDYELWLRIGHHFEIGYSKIPLVYYRKHSKSMTGTGVNKIEYYLKIAEKYRDNPLFNKTCRNLRQHTLYRYCLDGEFKKGWKMLIQDFRFERFYISVFYKFFIKRRLDFILGK